MLTIRVRDFILSDYLGSHVSHRHCELPQAAMELSTTVELLVVVSNLLIQDPRM